MNPYFSPGEGGPEIEIRTEAEADEFRSYTGNKGKISGGVILARRNGRRTDESCSRPMNELSVFSVDRYCTDDWKSCGKYIPPDRHIIGKADTWRIERRNLDFRTHIRRLNRKTICFSRDEKIHDDVIGMYIDRCYFQNGRFSESV